MHVQDKVNKANEYIKKSCQVSEKLDLRRNDVKGRVEAVEEIIKAADLVQSAIDISKTLEENQIDYIDKDDLRDAINKVNNCVHYANESSAAKFLLKSRIPPLQALFI